MSDFEIGKIEEPVINSRVEVTKHTRGGSKSEIDQLAFTELAAELESNDNLDFNSYQH